MQKRWVLCALFWGIALAAFVLLLGLRTQALSVRERVEELRQLEQYARSNQRHIAAMMAAGKNGVQHVASSRLGLLAIKEDLMQRAVQKKLTRIRIDAPQAAEGSFTAELTVACTGPVDGFLQFLQEVRVSHRYLSVDTVLLENNKETGQSSFSVTTTYHFEET